MGSNSFRAILRALLNNEVRFVVVGDLSATLQGAPTLPLILEVVHSTESGNVERLSAALQSLEAIDRRQPKLRLVPAASELESTGVHLLLTRFGPLDVLGRIGRRRAYEDLMDDVRPMFVDEGVSVQVLNLETLIAIKEEVGAGKDLAVLPLLRSVLNERKRQAHGG